MSDDQGFAPGLRVRQGGPTGPRGVLRCITGPRQRAYWMVHLDDGRWLWPADIVVDGPGDTVIECAQCRLRARVEPGAVLCSRCDHETFGAAADPGRGK